MLEQQKNLQSSLKDVALFRRLNQQKDFMLQQSHHIINIPCFSWRTAFLTQWVWIPIKSVLSAFLYSKFHKTLISVLFEDRKVHFALMGEDQSVQLKTMLPPHRVNICGSLFCNLLLKINGRCLHRFQCKLSPQSGTGKFSA